MVKSKTDKINEIRWELWVILNIKFRVKGESMDSKGKVWIHLPIFLICVILTLAKRLNKIDKSYILFRLLSSYHQLTLLWTLLFFSLFLKTVFKCYFFLFLSKICLN